MRLNYVGDWIEQNGALYVKVGNMNSVASELAVALHELVEALLCVRDGVPEWDVSEYDRKWNEREAAGEKLAEEPGNEMDAPYHKQHESALFVERAVCSAFGLPWSQHEENIDAYFAKETAQECEGVGVVPPPEGNESKA